MRLVARFGVLHPPPPGAEEREVRAKEHRRPLHDKDKQTGVAFIDIVTTVALEKRL